MLHMAFLFLFVLCGLLAILLVMLQSSKGGGLASMLGGGSDTLLGGSAMSLISKVTLWSFILFFVLAVCVGLSQDRLPRRQREDLLRPLRGGVPVVVPEVAAPADEEGTAMTTPVEEAVEEAVDEEADIVEDATD